MIRLANKEDLSGILSLYSAVHDALESGTNYPGWTRGIYPAEIDAQEGLERNDLYVMDVDGEIAGVMSLNHEQPEPYQEANWSYKAQGDEILLIHTLMVRPSCRGGGLGREMVAFAEELAAKRNCKVMRFDTYEKNLPAIRLYEGLGYRFAGLVDLKLPGRNAFRCYEKLITVDSKVKFTGKADSYAKSRPSYPKELLGELALACGLTQAAVSADIGAGTGILTKLLLDQGWTVDAAEPNSDMRGVLEKELCGYPGLTAVAGTAEETGLPTSRYDLVTAAQAFHWFDALAFQKECRRILKANGTVALIWNSRDFSSELVQDNAALCQRLCPAFHGFSNGMEDQQDKLDLFFPNGYVSKVFRNDLQFDRDGFLSRNLSASYAPRLEDQSYGAFCAAVNALFDKHQENGWLFQPNLTEVYYGKV